MLRHVDGDTALVEDVAEGDVHAALGGEADAGRLADFAERLPLSLANSSETP